MDKKRNHYFALGFGVLLLVVVILLAREGFRETSNIRLPTGQTDSVETGGDGSTNSLNVVRITPNTVQPAINTLSRPASYSRVQTVELFWSGGSGLTVSQVYVSGGRTRIDTTMSDGSVRHELVTGGAVAVWYDEEENWSILRSEVFSADIAQRMLTYETVRTLPVHEIAEADYRDLDGEACIYVATQAGEDGYGERYWVSVSTGLLKQAERVWEDQVVYRFTAANLVAEPPSDELFLLPDGSVLDPIAAP